ncbi:MAG: DUF2314 domain-containing protein [Acidobacteriales bacterium]|nr:DUF2314 domain-containing protein [Terriglobales bacterium]
MANYESGDYVKVEFTDHASGESEWMWMILDSWDCEARVLFGTLDNQPILTPELKLGEKLAVSFDKVVAHRKASSFQ